MRRFLVLGAVLLVGCSSSGGGAENSVAGGGAATGAGASAGGTTSASGATSTGGSSGANASSGGAIANAGSSSGGSGELTSTLVSFPSTQRAYLSALQFSGDSAAYSYLLGASFGVDRGQWDGCTKNQLGACWYYDCPAGSDSLGAIENPAPTFLNAGMVSFTTGLGTNSLLTESDLEYRATGNTQLLPATAGTLTFSASGSANVPALSIDVASPPTVRLTSLNGSATPTVITRSDGAKVVWTSSGTGQVFFGIYEYTGERPGAFCQFDASAGAGELPAALLEQLDAGPKYYAQIRGDSRAHAEMNGWVIDAYVYAYGETQALESVTIALQ